MDRGVCKEEISVCLVENWWVDQKIEEVVRKRKLMSRSKDRGGCKEEIGVCLIENWWVDQKIEESVRKRLMYVW